MFEMMTGFGNMFTTECIDGVIPTDQNSPQKVANGLYAEQINGSAFTAPRTQNFKSWQYRIRPSVSHQHTFKLSKTQTLRDQHNPDDILTPPDQMRWNPLPIPTMSTDFANGLVTMAYNPGGAIHFYVANTSMTDSYFYNADGDFLIVPQLGGLILKTEMGHIDIEPGFIAVIQRGIRFQVELKSNEARGYICETQGAPFVLPDRGPIGANGLADERHFEYPVAAYEEKEGDFTLYAKFQGRLWQSDIQYSPLDVVAWHGNYAPYRYDLNKFQPVWAVKTDHSDPSIFTVMTSPTETPGTANIDFVIFPERWMVVENTFRPPYYHRNIMSEFMGLISGVYDAKVGGFVPGGSSLHNCMSAHGPDAKTFEKASKEDLKPVYYDPTLAFMFESSKLWQATRFAQESDIRQQDYLDCWQGLNAHFEK